MKKRLCNDCASDIELSENEVDEDDCDCDYEE